jgi:4-amino-4-deoxy-L-arabinose transferase-like glycosyltransferase
VVLLAGALRFYAIGFGLPYLNARPDESAAVLHARAIMGGDFNPHFFHWPSLTFYAFAAVFTFASDVLGAVAGGRVLADSEYLVLARVAVALAGTATIVVLYDLGRRIADAWTGIAAAVFLAVAVLHVRESHFAMTDVLMTLLVTSSLALLVRALDALAAEHLRWFAAAGLTGGLAAATKYNAAAVIVAMAVVQLALVANARGRARTIAAWMPLPIFVAAFACGFVAGTPYAVFDWPTFVSDLRFDFAHLSGGHGIELGRGWFYHLTRSLPYGAGLTTCIAALGGVIAIAKDASIRGAAVGAFALSLYVAVGNGLTVFFRYVLPLVPIVCLLAAIAVRHAGRWLAARTPLSSGPATVLLMAVVAGPPLANSLRFDRLLDRTDTRVLAGDWLRSRATAGETLYEEGGYYAAIDLAGVPLHRWSFNPATGSFGDADGRTPDWLVLEESPLRFYASVSPELKRLAADWYTLVREIQATNGRWAVYDLEDAFFMPVAGFGSVERPGPTVRIYRRGDLPPVAR